MPKTALDWMVIRGAWESGEYTFPILSEKFNISVARLKQKSKQDHWKKGKKEVKSEIEKKVRESTEEILTRLGMPKERRVQLLMEGVEKADRLVFEGKGENTICTPVPDYKVRLDYLAELNKMTGDYSATKTELKIEELQFEILPPGNSGNNGKSSN
jgi:hypothetical protein